MLPGLTSRAGSILDWLATAAGRSVAAATVFATLISFLWPDKDWEIHPDAASVLVVAVIVWLASLRRYQPLSEHDRALLAKFRAILSEDEKDFLKTYDLGNPFSWHSLDGTQELARWSG